MANRQRMAQATHFFKQLTPEQKKRYAQEMKKNNYRFNGKDYFTLRGYVIARFFKQELLWSSVHYASIMLPLSVHLPD